MSEATSRSDAGWCIPCREYHTNANPHCRSAYQYSHADDCDHALEVEALGQRMQSQYQPPAQTPEPGPPRRLQCAFDERSPTAETPAAHRDWWATLDGIDDALIRQRGYGFVAADLGKLPVTLRQRVAFALLGQPKSPPSAPAADLAAIQAEADAIEARDIARRARLGLSLDTTPWPLRDVVRRLAEAATHLLDDHDCDCTGHGYEEVRMCIAQAERYLATHSATPPQTTEVHHEPA